MKKKVFNVILVILTIGMIYEGYSFFNIKQDNKVLEDIKTVDVFNNKDKTLSIKVQSGGENNFEWYEPENRSKWPDKAQYTYVGTKCVDASNQDIANSTAYVNFNENTYTATITTKQTVYCTLYFGKGRPALEVLDNQGGTYYGGGNKGNRTAVQGLYRFKGNYDQVTNNFICIGGSLNPEKCGTESSNKNLYRIIGVTDGTEKDTLGLEAGMLKVIKVIPSSTSQAWAGSSSSRYDYTWDYETTNQSTGATARWYLNNTFYNGLEAGIKGIIPAVYWWKGDIPSQGASETKTKTTAQYQIGLMYQSDYYNAGSQDTNNWLHITNTMSGKTSTYRITHEWTMTRYGYSGNFFAWRVEWHGNLGRDYVDNTAAVRPVFYLPSTTGLVGNGTESSPYVITSLSNS